ncbi:MAG: ATP-binding cassette domain-containing protein, partial [Ginsengibacter sp.]
MKIDLVNAGKRFNREWVFRRFSYSFFSQKTYAITGPNGSGKSTFLQVLCGASQQSEGDLKYHLADKEILPDQVYKHFSFAAPYLDLIEEMTLNEFFSFHAKMKGWIKEING